MKREIVTRPLSTEQITNELEFFADYLQQLGYKHCEVVFGYAWGMEYYPGADWPPVEVSLADLVSTTQGMHDDEAYGGLGSNDLYVTVPPLSLEFNFCHESDIHIRFSEPCEITGHFYQRWHLSGFSPAEWQISSDEN